VNLKKIIVPPPPLFIANNFLENVLRKMFVFAIPALLPVSQFYKLKIPLLGF